MAKFRLEIKKRGEVIHVYETDRFSLKFGVIQDLYEIYEAYVSGNMEQILGNVNLMEAVIELVKETFWDITDEHIREIDVIEMISDLGPQVGLYLMEQFESMGKQKSKPKMKSAPRK